MDKDRLAPASPRAPEPRVTSHQPPLSTATRSAKVDVTGLFACVFRPPSPHIAADEQGDTPATPTRVSAPGLVSLGTPQPASDPLVQLAEEFSPRYEQPGPELVVIDIRGLERLLGAPRTIGEEIRRDAADRRLRVHVAIASTRMAAMVLAVSRPGLTVVRAGGEGEALAGVPLRVLEQVHDEHPHATASNSKKGSNSANSLSTVARRAEVEAVLTSAVAVMKHWGLRTLGELAALPAADLVARLGARARSWQAIARGEDTRPLIPLRPEERFDAAIELEWPIEGLEPLSFVLTRLLEPLSTRLERRDRGTAALHTALHLVNGEMHTRSVQLPSPLREVRALRTLALLDLESHPPAAAIDRVTITIDPTPGRICQHTLFARPHPTPEQLSTLIARLNALMGQDRVGAPVTVDIHRPGVFAMQPFAVEHKPASLVRRSAERDQPPPRLPRSAEARSAKVEAPEPRVPSAIVSALRRFRPSVPARVTVDAEQRPIRVMTDRRGYAVGMVTSCAGPWRTSGAWWEGPEEEKTRQTGAAGGAGKAGKKDSHWNREEWDIALADGTVYRMFRDCDTNGWFLDGQVD